jgi:PAS domain S-box-containing protein
LAIIERKLISVLKISEKQKITKMKIEPNLNFIEINNDKILNSPDLVKLQYKYLFALLGFGLGSLFSLVIVIIEDYTGDISVRSGHSHWHHLAVPFIIGIIGSFLGYLYGKRRTRKHAAIHELLVSQRTLSLITDNLPVLISYVDTDLCYRFVNKTHEVWFGLSIDDFYGKQIKDLVSAKSFDLINSSIKKSAKGETVSFESTRKFKDGDEHSINSVIVPHFGADKKIKGFFTIVSDITKLKEEENIIKKQKEELSELNATKDKFFSIIAHDLKNPFNSLLGLSELLFKDYEAYDEESRKEFISLIYDTTQNTYKLLENLLFWSRTQSGRITFNPSHVNIKILVDENIDLLNSIAIGKNIHLQSDIIKDLLIDTDKDLVNTVIRNLISNAIKFTPQNGEINITSRPVIVNNLDNFIEISVKDTGVGISEETITRLFKIAENRSTPGTQGEQGTGLGLVLCRECIEKCGGKIWVESEVGKGSTFSFTVPLNGAKFSVYTK